LSVPELGSESRVARYGSMSRQSIKWPSTVVSCPGCGVPHQNSVVRMPVNLVVRTIAFVIALEVCAGAQRPSPSGLIHRGRLHSENATFSQNDGLSIIAAALDVRDHALEEDDCSHLVHAIYQRAGFSYHYASSRELYRGIEDFRRVSQPQVGDLIVWKGHVGIIVNPAQRLFFSSLRSGPGVDAYDAQYWKKRGQARFYRYTRGGTVPEESDSR
jgi:hypothetical protein